MFWHNKIMYQKYYIIYWYVHAFSYFSMYFVCRISAMCRNISMPYLRTSGVDVSILKEMIAGFFSKETWRESCGKTNSLKCRKSWQGRTSKPGRLVVFHRFCMVLTSLYIVLSRPQNTDQLPTYSCDSIFPTVRGLGNTSFWCKMVKHLDVLDQVYCCEHL